MARIITVKGTLPFGIEKDGMVHRDFEIRPRLVKDTLEIAREQGRKKIEDDDMFFTMCLTAKQILHIGDIQPVPVELLLEMLDEDMAAILDAKEVLATRLESFRMPASGSGEQSASDVSATGDSQSQENHSGAAQDPASDGRDKGDDGV